MRISPRHLIFSLALSITPGPLLADAFRFEPGLSQSVRTPELEAHYAQDDAVRRGATGANRGGFNSPWAGNWSATLPLRIEYDRRPDRGNSVAARFRFAEFRSQHNYSSFATHRFRSRDLHLLSTHEIADHRSSDQDLELGYRWRIDEGLFLLPFAGVRLHRLSGERRSRSFGRGILGNEEKTVFGFTDPDHSTFRAGALGGIAGIDGEWRRGALTLLGGLRAVSVTGAYSDAGVSLLYNPGLGANYMDGRFSASTAGYRMTGILVRLGGRYSLGGPVSLTLELQRENYRVSLPDFATLDYVSVESLFLAQVTAQTETELFGFDRNEFMYDNIFYAEPRPLQHTTAFLGLSIRIDTSGRNDPPARPPGPDRNEDKKPEAEGPRETAARF